MSTEDIQKPNSEDESAKNTTEAADVNQSVLVVQRMSIRNKMKEAMDEMKAEGMLHGAFGIVHEDVLIESIAQTRADEVLIDLQAHIEHQVTQREFHVDELAQEYARERTNHERAVRHAEILEHDVQHHPRYFNRSAAVFYLIFGIFILLADIPLALILIQTGFNFPNKPDYPISELFTNLWIIPENWEVFLTAIGISFCTIMIKIVYDEYMATPLGHLTVRKKSFRRLFGKRDKTAEEDELTNREVSVIAVENWTKFAVKLSILGLTLWMIFTLGEFRIKNKAINDEIEQYEKKKDILKESDASTDAKFDTLEYRHTEDLETYRKEAKEISETTFKIVTCMFPLISGICLSISFTIFNNYRRRLEQKELIGELQKALCERREILKKEKAQLAVWTHEDETVNAVGWLANFTKRLQQIYQYGFVIGRIHPEAAGQISDPISMVEKWRNRTLHFKTNEKLLKLTSNGKDDK